MRQIRFKHTWVHGNDTHCENALHTEGILTFNPQSDQTGLTDDDDFGVRQLVEAAFRQIHGWDGRLEDWFSDVEQNFLDIDSTWTFFGGSSGSNIYTLTLEEVDTPESEPIDIKIGDHTLHFTETGVTLDTPQGSQTDPNSVVSTLEKAEAEAKNNYAALAKLVSRVRGHLTTIRANIKA